MADANMSTIYTVGGYVAVAAISYAFYQTLNKKKGVSPAELKSKAARSLQPEARKEDSKKKQRLQNYASAAKSKPQVEEPAAPATTTQTKAKPDDDKVDREFAKQLAKAQEGHKFAKSEGGSKKREKSVKQSLANESSKKAQAAPQPEPTSNEEPEVEVEEEEQSPAESPEVTAADSTGVADMLEPASSKGPSILRLTSDPNKPQPKQKAAKAPEVVETKKQRQNRKKAAAAKEARDEAEKERKVLEEKQRRTARIAEGRAAKDGSQFVAANGGKSSWTQGAPKSNGTKEADTDSFHQPLDTFEKPTTVASETAQKNTTTNGLPAEAETVQELQNEEEEWSTVQTKSSKSKKSKQDLSASSGDEAPKASKAQAPTSAPSRPAAAPKATPANYGSFSALSAKNEPAEEEEVEEEWDV